MNNPTRFLIIRLSSIGDIVLTTPVVRCLKTGFNGPCEIHYLTKKTFAPLLENNPYIDELITIDEGINEKRKLLLEGNYDFIIDLHRNLRSLRIKRWLKKPAFSFDKLNREKWLLVNFKINKLPDIHIVDRYLATLNRWGIKNDNQGLDYFLGPKDKVTDWPESFPKDYVAISVGAAHPTKTIPANRLKTLVEKLRLPVVLLGGKEDHEKAALVAKGIKHPIFNACGKYTINQSAHLIKLAQVIITHDTGIMHIAAAFQKPILSVWGNTVPQFGMYPYMPQNPDRSKIYEVKDLRCRPCTKIGYDRCPKKHFKCMNSIDLDRLSKTANDWFAKVQLKT